MVFTEGIDLSVDNMNLIVVESPTKAKTLSKFLGKDFLILATKGHIKDLPKSKLAVDIGDNFTPQYVWVKKREKEILEIKRKGAKARNVFIATDPDREGEAIAFHVLEAINGDGEGGAKASQSPKIFRITFHEITKDAVQHAVSNPGTINKDLVNAQIARRVLDRIVGYKTSPLLWKKIRVGLSAGRVQTVALRLIVEREREIEKFVPSEYWEIYVEVKRREGGCESFSIKLVKVDGRAAKISDSKLANEISSDLEVSKYEVANVVAKEVKRYPYPPFTTSTLTQAAARSLGWSSKKTMSIAQTLYEEGIITYHRTDSTNLSSEAVEKARQFIMSNYGSVYLPPKPIFYKTKSKSAQEAHEAIRPTVVDEKPRFTGEKWKKEKEILYSLIWKRFVSCQMSPSVYDEITIDTKAVGKKEYVLRASGQTLKFDGWRKAYGFPKSGVESDLGQTKLPLPKKGEDLDKIKVDLQQKFTQPPSRYTEATLIKTLEKLGIGRPSTYAPTISTIQARQYVEKDEGKFRPTNLGTAVNDFLIGNFKSEFDYGFTAGMEENLDKIANGGLDWVSMMRDFYYPFEKKVEEVEKNSERVKVEVEKLGKACPECNEGELVVRVGRFGKFISCSRFPDCRYTERLVEKINMKCPQCGQGEVIVKKSKKGRKFFGCSRYPDCKWASWNKPQNS